jgi:hypothetical protein
VEGVPFVLLLGSARIAEARLLASSPSPAPGCTGWPVMRVQVGAEEGATAGRWNLGVVPGRVDGIAFDSLPMMASGDSLSLAIAIARAASSLAEDTSSVFQGRPYVVRQADLFGLADGPDGVLAEVVRTVNQEANPIQEQLVLVLEGYWRSPDSTLRVQFEARSVGFEETIPAVELLAVVRTRASHATALLVRREDSDGWALELLERSSTGRWSLRWRSARSDC